MTGSVSSKRPLTDTAVYVDPSLTSSRIGISELSFAELIAKSLAHLDPEFLAVLDRIYGISTGRPLSLEQTAQDLGTTVETVEQLHRHALRSLFRR